VGPTGPTGSGGGGKSLYTAGTSISSGNGNVQIDAFADNQTDVDNISVILTGGNVLAISNVAAGVRLHAVTVSINSAVNTATNFSIQYPEVNGQTTLATTQFPMFIFFNAGAVIQAMTNITISNTSGTVQMQKTSLTANTAYYFRMQF